MSLVFLCVLFPLHGHIRIRENRLNGTLRLTCAAVDTLVGMNVELVLTFIDAIDRANLDATRVVLIDAGLSNNVCHSFTRLSCLIPITKAAKF